MFSLNFVIFLLFSMYIHTMPDQFTLCVITFFIRLLYYKFSRVFDFFYDYGIINFHVLFFCYDYCIVNFHVLCRIKYLYLNRIIDLMNVLWCSE